MINLHPCGKFKVALLPNIIGCNFVSDDLLNKA